MQQQHITLREDIYQTYHPFILRQLNRVPTAQVGRGGITLDNERAAFMFDHHGVSGQRVIDIGANQGYLAVEAALRGAEMVDAFESNEVDGEFLSQASKSWPELGAVAAHPINYDFGEANNGRWNYVICLNVLHHIGRYFDNHIESLPEARIVMAQHLQRLLAKGGSIWLQLGFNWQGNTQQPMFAQGTKREMTEFVESVIGPQARISTIGIYNPEKFAYEQVAQDDLGHVLWQRFDNLGEFGNRPLYLIQSVM